MMLAIWPTCSLLRVRHERAGEPSEAVARRARRGPPDSLGDPSIPGDRTHPGHWGADWSGRRQFAASVRLGLTGRALIDHSTASLPRSSALPALSRAPIS